MVESLIWQHALVQSYHKSVLKSLMIVTHGVSTHNLAVKQLHCELFYFAVFYCLTYA